MFINPILATAADRRPQATPRAVMTSAPLYRLLCSILRQQRVWWWCSPATSFGNNVFGGVGHRPLPSATTCLVVLVTGLPAHCPSKRRCNGVHVWQQGECTCLDLCTGTHNVFSSPSKLSEPCPYLPPAHRLSILQAEEDATVLCIRPMSRHRGTISTPGQSVSSVSLSAPREISLSISTRTTSRSTPGQCLDTNRPGQRPPLSLDTHKGKISLSTRTVSTSEQCPFRDTVSPCAP